MKVLEFRNRGAEKRARELDEVITRTEETCENLRTALRKGSRPRRDDAITLELFEERLEALKKERRSLPA